MKRLVYKSMSVLAVGLAVMGCTGETEKKTSPNPESEKKAIEQLIEQYVKTINECDTALVNQIWSHDAKVSFIGPSGYYSPYTEIRDSLVHGIFGTHFTKRDLRKENLKIELNGDAAWSEFTWTFDATRTDGKAHHTKGRETQIFERGNDGIWRLIHIHYSSIP